MLIINRNRSGFTLLELIIAMLLGTIIMAAVFGVLESSNMAYVVQEEVAASQQDVRISRTWLERDTRMMGAGLANYPPVIEPEGLEPAVFENSEGKEGSDRIWVRYVIPEPNACGEPPTGNTDPPCDSLPNLTLSANMMPSSSAVANVNEEIVKGEDWDGDCYCNGDVYTEPQKDMEVLIVAPPGYLPPPPAEQKPLDPSVVVVTQVLTSGKVGNHPVDKDKNKIFNFYPAGSTIMFVSIRPINVYYYYIDDDYVLIREDWTDVEDPATDNPIVEPIAENIEDMQFAFGLDLLDEGGASGQDGVVDTWEDGTGANMDGNDLSTDVKPFIKTVRITLIGRSDKEHQDLPANKRPAIEDHAEADAADYYHRRLSQVTVQLRNLGL